MNETKTDRNTDDINEILVKYNSLRQQKSNIEEEMNKIRPRIMEYITKNLKGNPFEYNGVKATLTNGTKRTLVAESIEKIFSIRLTDDCYKIATYPILKISNV